MRRGYSCTAAPQECILLDFDCAAWKFDPQDCKLGSLTNFGHLLRQIFHGGLSMFLCCQLVSFLHIHVIFHKCIKEYNNS
jgi:hypothetical protein